MPRTYIFTIILTAIITVIAYHAYESKEIQSYEIIAVLCMIVVLYVNEKTANLENMLSCRVRRVLSYGAVGMMLLMVVFLVVFFYRV